MRHHRAKHTHLRGKCLVTWDPVPSCAAPTHTLARSRWARACLRARRGARLVLTPLHLRRARCRHHADASCAGGAPMMRHENVQVACCPNG
eukprot:559572-Prymnesium_polylepis.1